MYTQREGSVMLYVHMGKIIRTYKRFSWCVYMNVFDRVCVCVCVYMNVFGVCVCVYMNVFWWCVYMNVFLAGGM